MSNPFSEYEAWQRRLEEGLRSAEMAAADLAVGIGQLEQNVKLLRQSSYRGGCGQIRTTVILEDTTLVEGAVVVVKDASDIVVGSCTTNALGVCSVAILLAGTYTVTVSKEGYADVTQEVVATCKTNDVLVELLDEGPDPCCEVSVPMTLFLSDGIDTIELTYNHAEFPGTMWSGCVQRTVSNGRDTTINSGEFQGAGGCVGGAIEVSTTLVYVFGCVGGAYFLSINHRACAVVDEETSVTLYYWIAGAACDSPWSGPGGALSGYGGPFIYEVGPGAVDNCSPFSVAFAHTFPTDDSDAVLMATMFGASGSWTITE